MINAQAEASGNSIAIIGMECMFPKARNLAEYWRLLRSGEDAITDTPASHWSIADYFDPDPRRPDMTYCHRGGFLSPVDFDPTEFGIPPTILEATDTSQLLSLLVAKRALEDAGYSDGREFNRDRASVILGITGLQELALPLGARLGHPKWRKALAEAGVPADVAEDVMSRISDSYVSWQENSFPGLLGNVVAGRIANRLNLRGTNCVVDAACASSLSAVHLAMMELATGRCDMALAGGVDTLNDIFMYMCFSKTPALSPSGDARPFSDAADGTVLGEGIGILVLKRLADAQRDGDRIYAVIRAMGTSSDGRSQSIYAPHAAGQARALRNAYELAGVRADSIGLIEGHGTGTKVGDAVEFEALRVVFREARSDGAWCAVGSVKSQIGHTKAAAGAAGLIKTALSIYHAALPPTIKIDAPNAKLGVEDSPFYLSTKLRPWIPRHDEPRRAGVSSFGFGGSNFHAVLEEHPATARMPAWDGSVQIIAMSAGSQAALRERANQWRIQAADISADPDRWAYEAQQSRRTFDSQDPFRLIIVIESDQDAAHILEQAADRLMESGSTSWIAGSSYFGSGHAQGRLAMLFPGQGSQYLSMGRDLACTFPEFFEALRDLDSLCDGADETYSSAIYPPPTFDEGMRAKHERHLTQTQIAQPVLGAVERAYWKTLDRFGLMPDMVAGHSFGELVALHVAGVFDARTLGDLSCLRGQLMASGDDDRGTMLAVKASTEQVDALIHSEKIEVVIANRNSPAQVVLSGPRDEIARAAKVLNSRSIPAKQLAVSGAFHSRLMESAVSPFRNALASLNLKSPSIPVFSGSTASPYSADEHQAAEILGRQLLDPVNFVDVIDQMYQAGARSFVEVGPRQVLTGLVESILSDRIHCALAVDSSGGRRSGVADLGRILAQLAAEGRPVRLDQWERTVKQPRTAKMSIRLVGANYRAPVSEEKELSEQVATKVQHPPSLPTKDLRVNPPEHFRAADARPAPQLPNMPTGSDSLVADALRMVQEGLMAMQALQQQTAAAHQRFLEGQEQAHRLIQQMMENQHRLLTGNFGDPAAAPSASVHPLRPTSPILPQPPLVAASPVQPPAAKTIPASAVPPPTSIPAPVIPTEARGSTQESVVLDVVCEKTGYPREMIDLSMDIEADLGIDSIKRVEIVAAIEERIPGFAGIKPEDMGSIRTLKQIVALIDASAGVAIPDLSRPAVRTTESTDRRPGSNNQNAIVDFGPILIDVVSQLTGYPKDMIDLAMDLEADLGIDSIKRVEILAAVEARVPEMPAVQPDFMGTLRTLQQIVEYCCGAEQKSIPEKKTSRPIASQPAARIARRVLRTVELPTVKAKALEITAGREVWVTRDGSGLAQSVVAELDRRGIGSRLIDLQDPLPESRSVGGLIILSQEKIDAGLRQCFKLMRHVAKDLIAAADGGGSILVSIARMDGAFGLLAAIPAPAQGGLAGLIKTAAQEWPAVKCKALDVDSSWGSDATVAGKIVDELAQQGPVEIGLSARSRRTIELVESLPEVIADADPSSDVFLFTGGGRGVAAAAGLALAKKSQTKLAIFGRSPPPTPQPNWLAGLQDEAEIKKAILNNEFAGKPRPTAAQLQSAYERHVANRELAENLQSLQATGSQVLYRQVDVRDGSGVSRSVNDVQAVLGPISGIVHAAGVLEDRLIVDKTPEQFDRVVGTKVGGLNNLLEAIDTSRLRHLVLFSSVSARFGSRGQADYSAANEVLNKTAQDLARRLPSCRVKSLNWGPWDGGMVGPGLRREFQRRGVELIPLEQGAAAFVDELLDKTGDVEVVIGAGLAPTTSQPANDAPLPRMTGPSEPTMEMAFERHIDVHSHPFLHSHVLGGRPVLPFAMTMEWLAHAASHAQPGLVVVGLDDARVLRGVSFDEQQVDLQFFTAEPVRTGDQTLIRAEMRTRREASPLGCHASATVVLATRRPAAPSLAYSDAVADRAFRLSSHDCYQEVLFHGPHFHAIEAIEGFSARGLIARLVASSVPSDWMTEPMRSEWLTDPLIVDSAFQMAIVWSAEELGELCLPARIGRYRQFCHRFPSEGVTAVLEVREHTPRRILGDVTYFNLDAVALARLDDVEMTVDQSLREAFGRRPRVAAES